jgi:hypothetical protein
MGTSGVAEIRMAPVVEFQRRRAKGFPLRRESVHAWCLSCSHRWLADDKRGNNPKASKREGCEMIIGVRRRVNL